MAFYSLEPFGPEAVNINTGIIASTIANVKRNTDKRPEPFKATDFALGSFEEEEEQRYVQTPEEQKQAIEMLAAAFGAKKIKRTKKRG